MSQIVFIDERTDVESVTFAELSLNDLFSLGECRDVYLKISSQYGARITANGCLLIGGTGLLCIRRPDLEAVITLRNKTA